MKLVIAAALISASMSMPVFAQGQGGYATGVPGASTPNMSADERAAARARHQTNDSSGGASSIDKSGKTQEAGGTIDGPHQGEAERAGKDGRRGRGQ
jgi:hypothetical protein